MRKVIGIGETILDIVFKDEHPIDAVPGGSVFNGLISLGRAGFHPSFISETGNDRVGQRIIQFTKDNQVDASNIVVYPGSKSPVSLAFLNERNDAEYIFYKDHPHDRLEFVYPDIQADDIVMFGSFYAVNPVIRQQFYAFLEYAHKQGAILYYDVNYRSSHASEYMKVRPNILENFELSTIIRGSLEDFEVMFGKGDAERFYRNEISFYCKNFICTHGAEPMEVRGCAGFSKQYTAKPLEIVSTIGAGDNFNAGFVYGILKYGIMREMLETGLSEEQWDALVSQAQQFAANVCQSINNSVDQAFADEKRQEYEAYQLENN